MKNKLIMIWQLLRSKECIVVTDKITNVDASTNLIARTMGILAPILIEEAVTHHKMDSAVDEVNNIINGIK
jgi:hypothetical protein